MTVAKRQLSGELVGQSALHMWLLPYRLRSVMGYEMGSGEFEY